MHVRFRWAQRLAERGVHVDDTDEVVKRKILVVLDAITDIFFMSIIMVLSTGLSMQYGDFIGIPIAFAIGIAVRAILLVVYCTTHDDTYLNYWCFLDRTASPLFCGWVLSGRSPATIWTSLSAITQGLLTDIPRRYLKMGVLLVVVMASLDQLAKLNDDFQELYYTNPARPMPRWVGVFISLVVPSSTILKVFQGVLVLDHLLAQEHVSLKFQLNIGDRLLRNMLPTSVAQELRDDLHRRQTTDVSDIASEHLIAAVQQLNVETIRSAALCFCDVVSFTSLAAQVTAEDLVSSLRSLFCSLDYLASACNVQKIKTIGDAYMAMGYPSQGDTAVDDGFEGMPVDAHENMFFFALGLPVVSRKHSIAGTQVRLRVGVHRGPVVSGVIGVTRFQWDVWGDTVNLSSRMESTGVPDKTQFTLDAKVTMGSRAIFVPRGTVAVKGKGSVETFLADLDSQVDEVKQDVLDVVARSEDTGRHSMDVVTSSPKRVLTYRRRPYRSSIISEASFEHET